MKWFKGLTVAKDPDAVIDWVWDWSEWLVDGETIASHTTMVANGLTKDSSTSDGTNITVWLSGGTDGNSYTVTVQVVTSAGRTQDRTVTFEVSEQ